MISEKGFMGCCTREGALYEPDSFMLSPWPVLSFAFSTAKISPNKTFFPGEISNKTANGTALRLKLNEKLCNALALCKQGLTNAMDTMQWTGLSMQSPGLSMQWTGLSLQSPGLSMQSSGLSLQSPGLSLQLPGLSLQLPDLSLQLLTLSLIIANYALVISNHAFAIPSSSFSIISTTR